MRGSVYRLRKPKDRVGHGQDGRRFAVVVQASRLDHLSRWIVAPTSASENVVPGVLRPLINWGSDESRVLCDAVQAVDPEHRLGDRVGNLTLSEMQEVDRALKFLLDL